VGTITENAYESSSYGVAINRGLLSKILQIPVYPTTRIKYSPEFTINLIIEINGGR